MQVNLARQALEKMGAEFDPSDLDASLENDDAFMLMDEIACVQYEREGGIFHPGNPPMPKDDRLFDQCTEYAKHLILESYPDFTQRRIALLETALRDILIECNFHYQDADGDRMPTVEKIARRVLSLERKPS